jgi:DNA segregation ATPase FtsK/SpoIIIE-like protein
MSNDDNTKTNSEKPEDCSRQWSPWADERLLLRQAKQLEHFGEACRIHLCTVEIESDTDADRFFCALKPGRGRLERFLSMQDEVAVALGAPGLKVVAPVAGKPGVILVLVPCSQEERLRRMEYKCEPAGETEDQQFGRAIEIVVRQGSASVALLQRELSLGYGRAARLIDLLTEARILSPPKYEREVLVRTADEGKQRAALWRMDAHGR